MSSNLLTETPYSDCQALLWAIDSILTGVGNTCYLYKLASPTSKASFGLGNECQPDWIECAICHIPFLIRVRVILDTCLNREPQWFWVRGWLEEAEPPHQLTLNIHRELISSGCAKLEAGDRFCLQQYLGMLQTKKGEETLWMSYSVPLVDFFSSWILTAFPKRICTVTLAEAKWLPPFSNSFFMGTQFSVLTPKTHAGRFWKQLL